MTATTGPDSGVRSGPELLRDLLAPDPPPFALLYRASRGRLEVLTGEVTELSRLADLPLPEPATPGTAGAQVLALIPFRQLAERGYACVDDGTPLLAMTVSGGGDLSRDDALDLLPDVEVSASGGAFDVADEEYAKVVAAVVEDEIRAGAGSNFVVKRSFTARLPRHGTEVALTIFRRLLAAEPNAYWTFVVHTGHGMLVGASPEQHVRVADGTAWMNPISGTYCYPPDGPNLPGVLDFLADQKETDELYMVVDEELKMMARVCDTGARLHGPYLRELARLAHTEFVLAGPSSLDVRDVLRETMFAPTVVGSPLQNACRVIARYERSGRGYYSGALALLGRDDSGGVTMDSTILIRTAEIDQDGTLRVDAGATLVRDSRPAAETAETWAKVDTLLAAAGLRGQSARRSAPEARLAGNPAVRRALAARNAGLSSFWLADRDSVVGDPRLGPVLVVDFEDMFTDMLGHQLRALGRTVTVRPWSAVSPDDVTGFDAVLLGPGPGDPGDHTDERIGRLRELVIGLLATGTPFVAECLSHQVLCALLGLRLHNRARPNQGTRLRIDLFGTPEIAGFYNSYAAVHADDRLHAPSARGVVELCRDQRTGEVHALRGNGFASTQFHLESVLTEHGATILRDLVAWATGEHGDRKGGAA